MSTKQQPPWSSKHAAALEMVKDVLAVCGVSQSHYGKRARSSGSYVSQLVSANGRKAPSQKIRRGLASAAKAYFKEAVADPDRKASDTELAQLKSAIGILWTSVAGGEPRVPTPGHLVSPKSQFYIQRSCDVDLRNFYPGPLAEPGESDNIVAVYGGLLTGKSSLVEHAASSAEQADGWLAARWTAQMSMPSRLEDIWQHMCHQLHAQLSDASKVALADALPTHSNDLTADSARFRMLLEKTLTDKHAGYILLVLDGVALLGEEVLAQLERFLRVFENRVSWQTGLQNCFVIMTAGYEPRLGAQGIANVKEISAWSWTIAKSAYVKPFRIQQVRSLVSRLALDSGDADKLAASAFSLFGGQPLLTSALVEEWSSNMSSVFGDTPGGLSIPSDDGWKRVPAYRKYSAALRQVRVGLPEGVELNTFGGFHNNPSFIQHLTDMP